ncbi:hypothetical protein F4677DRAFT_451003 [Hypoxylon crocopeplum]|nr:hypothetical protein F4677DRAFT_451003 [Hypoxylon crocopeplum]
MAYQPLYTYDQGHPIYLYTTTLGYQSTYLKFKKPIDAIGHWAVCIQGQCYEVTRNKDPAKKKKDPKYLMRSLPEHEWSRIKDDEKRPYKRIGPMGYTARSWPIQTIKDIADQVWRKSLQSKYVYDENNCQVFVRLLVDLIGNKQTQAEFPAAFDVWVKNAGTTRDSTVLVATAAMATVAATASLLATPVDPTGTAAAGFAVSAGLALRSSAALWTDRLSKEKFIKKAQEELREEFRRRGILPY